MFRYSIRAKLAALCISCSLSVVGALIVLGLMGHIRYPAESIATPLETRKIGIWRDDPGLGWSHVPGATGRHMTSAYDVSYTIDARGCRITPPRSEGARTLALLGCSYTFGHGVNDHDTYAWRLAEAMPDWQVTNHAVMGYGTIQAWSILSRMARNGDLPDVVAYGYLSHHVTRNGRNRAWLQELGKFGRRSPAVRLVDGTPIHDGLIGPDDSTDADATKATIAMILAMRRTCTSAGTNFVLLRLPDRWQSNAVDETVIGVLQSKGVHVADLRHLAGSYNHADSHPLEDWHDAVADETVRVLRHLISNQQVSGEGSSPGHASPAPAGPRGSWEGDR